MVFFVFVHACARVKMEETLPEQSNQRRTGAGVGRAWLGRDNNGRGGDQEHAETLHHLSDVKRDATTPAVISLTKRDVEESGLKMTDYLYTGTLIMHQVPVFRSQLLQDGHVQLIFRRNTRITQIHVLVHSVHLYRSRTKLL